MQTKEAQRQTKRCSKCLGEFPLSEFYSMGNRKDSWCKPCKKAHRNAKYVSTKSVDAFDRIKKCLDLIYATENKQLDATLMRLERMVIICQKRGRQ